MTNRLSLQITKKLQNDLTKDIIMKLNEQLILIQIENQNLKKKIMRLEMQQKTTVDEVYLDKHRTYFISKEIIDDD